MLLRPLFMGAASCEKSESFLATFGPKLWSITLFVHARYGAMKVLCTGLVECGGVFGSKFKSSGHPHARPKNRTRSPSPARSTWHAAHNAKRPARPTNQYVWHSIWRYPAKRLRCQSNPGDWSCVVSGRSYVIAGSFVVSGCCANVPPLC